MMSERVLIEIDKGQLRYLLRRKALSASDFSCQDAREKAWLKQLYLELLAGELRGSSR